MRFVSVALVTLVAGQLIADEPKKQPAERPADPAKVAEAVQKLTSLLGSPEKLTPIAKQLANEAREIAVIGPTRAKLQVQEELLVQTRLEAIKIAEDAAKERKSLRADLDKELEEIRAQFKDDTARCEEELGVVLAGYLPMLRNLKATETQFSASAQRTSFRLNQIRQEKSSLERQGIAIRSGRSSGRLEPGKGEPDPELFGKPLPSVEPSKDKKPLKDLLEELKKLD